MNRVSAAALSVLALGLLVSPLLGQNSDDGLRLNGPTAADLVGPSAPIFNSAWSVEAPASHRVRPASSRPMEPRITSVPVAVVVGGLLIASLGITRQVRRSRDARV